MEKENISTEKPVCPFCGSAEVRVENVSRKKIESLIQSKKIVNVENMPTSSSLNQLELYECMTCGSLFLG